MKILYFSVAIIGSVLIIKMGYGLGVADADRALPAYMKAVAVLNRVNDYRFAHGLDPVYENFNSCQYASKRASEIIFNFSHDQFDPKQNLPGFALGVENLSKGFDYKHVVDEWIKSPAHEKVLLSDSTFMCARTSSLMGEEYWALVGYSN